MQDYVIFAIALLTITNPLGTMALFTGIVGDRTDAEKKATARQTGVAVAVIFVVVTWAGSAILAAFGVVPAGLQAAGGVILILMGLSMLRSQTPRLKSTKKEREAASDKEQVGVVPLAIPITAGPGAITTIILATQDLPTVMDRLILSGIGVALAMLLWLVLHFSGKLVLLLGETGIGVVTRIMGLLLTAIAFQMLTTGLKGLLPGLAG